MDAEVFVVDNCSTDGSRQYLSSRFPDISFRWNNSNDGFAKANNLALQEATGDYVLFLNPDTIVPEDCLEKCIHFFETRKQCGALGVRMIDGSGHFLKESKRSFPSAATSFYKMIGLTALLPLSPVFARYYATHIKENESGKVDVLPGAFMMVSKEAVKATGGFDERFFMYAEDIDLSYRVQQAGFKIAQFGIGHIVCIYYIEQLVAVAAVVIPLRRRCEHLTAACARVAVHQRRQKFLNIPYKVLYFIGMGT